jgi:hypothetical protein
MITPDERVPQDDLQGEEKDDQMSQEDIHSNGFDEYEQPLDEDEGEVDESDALRQAYKAADSSFTLDADDDADKDDE